MPKVDCSKDGCGSGDCCPEGLVDSESDDDDAPADDCTPIDDDSDSESLTAPGAMSRFAQECRVTNGSGSVSQNLAEKPAIKKTHFLDDIKSHTGKHGVFESSFLAALVLCSQMLLRAPHCCKIVGLGRCPLPLTRQV